MEYLFLMFLAFCLNVDRVLEICRGIINYRHKPMGYRLLAVCISETWPSANNLSAQFFGDCKQTTTIIKFVRKQTPDAPNGIAETGETLEPGSN